MYIDLNKLSEEQREKILIVLNLSVSCFSFADGVKNELVEKCFAETYDLWISTFVSALQSSVGSLLGIKKQIFRILIVLFRDFTFFSKKSLTVVLMPVWKFLNSFLPVYLF